MYVWSILEQHAPNFDLLVENFMFLGITINNKLNWNSHINKVTNKISKTVGILNKLRTFLPSGVLQTIYNTLILLHMIYGILAWGRHTKVIHKIQKRAIRIIAASKYNQESGIRNILLSPMASNIKYTNTMYSIHVTNEQKYQIKCETVMTWPWARGTPTKTAACSRWHRSHPIRFKIKLSGLLMVN